MDWHIHPFAPVTKSHCMAMKPFTLADQEKGFTFKPGIFDFDCNKDFLEGQDVFSLMIGETPYDLDRGTGEEFTKWNVDELKHVYVSNKEVDMACYLGPSLPEELISRYGSSIPFIIGTVVFIGALYLNPVTGVPAAFIFSAVAGGQLGYVYYEELIEPAMDVYSEMIVPRTNNLQHLDSIIIWDRPSYIFTSEEGLEELKETELELEKLKTYSDFHTSTLSLTFLNPSSRDKSLRQCYLLKIIYN